MIRGERWWASGTAVVVWIALGTVVVHLVTGWRYGFDRDELMALEDARHLAWGYVQYPPMTAFFGLGGAEIVWDVVGGISSVCGGGAGVGGGVDGVDGEGDLRGRSGEWGVTSGRADLRGASISAKDAERGGGPHFADSVRNDVFSCLRRRKPKSAGMKASATTAREAERALRKRRSSGQAEEDGSQKQAGVLVPLGDGRWWWRRWRECRFVWGLGR